MGGVEYKDYYITVNRKERVIALRPPKEHSLPLSNLDLLLPPVDTSVFLCYDTGATIKESNQLSFASMVDVLKASLAQALVTYYPFAGEMVTNSVGEPELHCNNCGVDFIEAYADVELRELRLYDPDDSVEKKLVPEKEKGVLCIQATELKCGALVLACTFDHRVADAYSTNMFLVAWAETARTRAISLVPSFQRSPLSPRSPGCYDATLDRLYMPISLLPPPSGNTPTDHAVNRIYYVASEDIDQMQAEASCGANRRSKLEAFSAYLWRIIGKAAKPNAKVCRLGIVVDGRARLGMASAGNDDASLVDKASSLPMASYFGNVLSLPYGTLSVEKLETVELRDVAVMVHEIVQVAATEEHFRELIDWVEAHRPEAALSRVYCEGAGNGEESGPAFVVSSGLRFPVREVDFGWGRPAFGSYHLSPGGSSAGYVMPMPSTRRDGDWVVYVRLMRGFIEALEAEAGDVLRRLTFDHLDLSLDRAVSPGPLRNRQKLAASEQL